jgi:hypothetical protein
LAFGKAQNLVGIFRVLLVAEQDRVKGEIPAGGMGDMMAEVGLPVSLRVITADEERGVVREVVHAIGGGGEDFGEKRVVMDAFVVASFTASVTDADKSGNLPPRVMDAGESFVVVLEKEDNEFFPDPEEAGSHGGELQDRAQAMALKALSESVPEALPFPSILGVLVREDEDVSIKAGHDPSRAVAAARVEAKSRTVGAKTLQDAVWVMGRHGLLMGGCVQTIFAARLGR